MKIFHHNDLDGHCAGAIAGRAQNRPVKEDDFVEVNYGPFPFDKISLGEKVIVVDFSLQEPGDWEKLLAITSDIIWIDHHDTAIEKAKAIPGVADLPGLRRTDRAACELAWEFFFQKEKMPYSVELAGIYDSWREEEGEWETANYFQCGMKMQETQPGSRIWEELLNVPSGVSWGAKVMELVEAGEMIFRYREKEYTRIAQNNSFPMMFRGLRAIACNTHEFQSQLFEAVWDEAKYDVMLAYIFDGNKFHVRIYSSKPHIHCGKLAQEFGGGGHRGAAGFKCGDLIITPFGEFDPHPKYIVNRNEMQLE